ncbi:MAG: ribonuclease [Sutterellaceae bacterium]|nr:ribonuclease [Sutterellaceae bacterium]MDY2867443.1 ribonuclease domain-containing protein [Mesosutterella sp.]
MLKNFFSRSRAVFSIGAVAVIVTIAIAAVILFLGHENGGSWGSVWGSAEEVTLEELPPEARKTLALIKSGGPFPYRQDGVRYRNSSKKLPIKRRGYYRSFIVPTPGVKGLGKRRIVAGAGKEDDYRKSGEYWYTSDEYGVLHRIREEGRKGAR